MNLIIDTSTSFLVTILDGEKGRFVAPRLTKKHQENLLPSIESLLVKAHSSIKDVDILGVVVGPGSFTGIRLAVATAKGFAFVDRHKKIVPINMLDLLGFVAKHQAKYDFCVCLKCTSSKIYVAQFDRNGKKLSQLVLPKEDAKTILCPEKFNYLDDEFFSFGSFKSLTLTDDDYVQFLSQRIDEKNFVSFEKLVPLYMALSQAEEELLKKQMAGKSK